MPSERDVTCSQHSSNQGSGDAVREDEPVLERLDHLERLCDTISDEVNWVRARDQIRGIRSWIKANAKH